MQPTVVFISFQDEKTIEPLLLLSTHSTLTLLLLVKVHMQQTLHKLNTKKLKSLIKAHKKKAHTTFTHGLKSFVQHKTQDTNIGYKDKN
jgi:hypothetical protein